ncbi:hypothetical protein E2C01_096992 [Portunus trituberculatus]|uniref:Uncharacterized protein n=1 Tax=Portunus trituberculatus TaxID=210409 RepID=A0A5B7JU01_PORTR|nr:hypothetical protein [Portunus trituberculatus]
MTFSGRSAGSGG